MLALLVLTLVTLALLVRVETSMAENHLRQSQAQQNATFALRRAIGELQRHAGADRSITAPAYIDPLTPTSNRSRYWTGVWEPGTTDPLWLVSGNEDGATGFSPDDEGMRIELVGEHSAGPDPVYHVEVPLIDIESAPNEISGRYAWWVGDEGVKARINVSDPFATAPAGTLESNARHMAPQRVAVEYLRRDENFAAGADFWFNRSYPDALLGDRAISAAQLAFAGPNPPLPSHLANRFHDVTSFSRGVLANAAAGGLKRDLTPVVSFFPNPAENDALEAYLAPALSMAISPTETPQLNLLRSWADIGRGSAGFDAFVAPRIYDPDTQRHGIHPVMVRAQMFVGASYFGPDALGNWTVRIHIMPVFVLWNPHNVGLSPADYEIRARIPDAAITFLGGTGTTFSSNPSLPLPAFLQFRVDDIDLKPGECRVLSLAAVNGWIPYAASTTYLLEPTFNANNAVYLDATGTRFTYTAPMPRIRLGLTRGSSTPPSFELGLDTGSGAVQIQSITSPGAFAAQSRSEESIGESTSANRPMPFMYSQMVRYGWSPTRANASAWTSIGYGGIAAGDWVGAVNDDVTDPTRQRTHTGPSWRSTLGGRTTAVLFDQPRDDSPILSVGLLAHMKVGADPDIPSSLVWSPRRFFDAFPSIHRLNTDPAIRESLWDRYFFSGVPTWLQSSDLEDIDFRLPNSRLRFYRPHGQLPPLDEIRFTTTSTTPGPIGTSAAHLVVDGAFNVNSRSIDAWRAILASYARVPVVDYDTRTESVGGALASVVAFPLSGAYVTGTGSQTAAPVWRGFRRLTDNEVESLAAEVCDAIEAEHVAMGRPFRTMMEFVDRGVFRTAIANAGLNTVFTNLTGPPAAVNVPGWVSHWDLLSALDPIVTMRSDTFRIRAYGEVVSPVKTNADGTPLVEGRAWCEAIVQRVPDYVDTSANPNAWEAPAGRNLTHGRRFEVVHFRWLTRQDI